jgi:hypothetical protein
VLWIAGAAVLVPLAPDHGASACAVFCGGFALLLALSALRAARKR